ncbi:MAG TPA: saccharopine dehydrogenase NADP-binding domain-containing protein [Actinomycetota bacterium]|nr:saccharopine dehydrogenase NADP-binding domain-containing protein [Actinomycetota bacterium]
MPDVLLFGATGYTGTLTAHALARRGTSFAIAGRDRARLETLAADTEPAAIHVVSVGDTDALVGALGDTGALITCVGPFRELGATAVDAALKARVHYVDSAGEIDFIGELIDRYGSAARDAGIAMVPAAGFDEVPSDVALSLAVDGMSHADAVVTYALPSAASPGTIRTILRGIGRSDASWISDRRAVHVATGSRARWAPMPPPLGPKHSVAMPLAEGVLAPLHLDLKSLELYATARSGQAALMKVGMPFARAALAAGPLRRLAEQVLVRDEGPTEDVRRNDRWTILAEARSPAGWRNVALVGADPYGLTAETLAAIAGNLAREGHEDAGVMSPVQAVGLQESQKELIDFGVDFQTWEGA